jgi:hypothetical protein
MATTEPIPVLRPEEALADLKRQIDERDNRPMPISFRPREEFKIRERLALVAAERDRAVNWVMNDILNQHLPAMEEK